VTYENLLSFNAKAELSRRKFRDFVLYVKKDYSMQWFHELLCDKLEAFYRGEIRKLMVTMPPQHGKSELTTRLFPSYMLGKNPNYKMVVASYSSTMATSFNRDIQRYIDSDEYHEIFPDTVLNESNVAERTKSSGGTLRNADIFEIIGHRGFLKSVGRGGALTGTPVDIGLIDDPIKDRQEAMSPTIRENLWSWYQDVFETRLHNDSQQIIILTRWHEEDLAGRLLARDSDWDLVKLEGIKETENLEDPREIGEALWPEKHSLERLQNVRDKSPLTFNSLYQQTPRPLDGQGIFWNRTHIQYKSDFDIDRAIISIDPATTSNRTSDETGLTALGKSGPCGLVMDDQSGKYTPLEWARVAMRLYEDYNASCIVAEKNQGGDMVETVLRAAGFKGRVILVTASKGKESRAEPVFGLYEQGFIYHFRPFIKLESQMVTFNPQSGQSPDRVDSIVHGFTELFDLNNDKKPLFFA
jgi:phage terminase large subunit-like protein